MVVGRNAPIHTSITIKISANISLNVVIEIAYFAD